MNNEKNMTLYTEERDKLFTQLLEDKFFSKWRSSTVVDSMTGRNRSGKLDGMELILFPKCNLKCTYCYITNHGDKLYPEVCNPDLILSNLKKIMDWIVKEKFIIKDLSLFSAEFFMQPQWPKVLDIIYEAAKKFKFSYYITIPTNMTWVMDEEKVSLFRNYYKKFIDIGMRICLSGSVDGKWCDNLTRPSKGENNIYTDEFYDKVFRICVEFSAGFHPMISSSNIHVWKENLDWYLDMYEKYGLDSCDGDHPTKKAFGNPFMLEVRNDDWTKESLEHYRDFMFHLFDVMYHRVFKGNLEPYVSTIFGLKDNEYFNHLQKTPIELTLNGRITCSIQHTLFIRTQYMDIVPCHRTCYKMYQYGKIKTDSDGNINGFSCNNISAAIKILNANTIYSLPVCANCAYNIICGGQCLGANYESNGDMFLPCESVCDMYHVKYQTVAELFDKYDLIEVAKRIAHRPANKDIKDRIMENIKLKEELICHIKNVTKYR